MQYILTLSKFYLASYAGLSKASWRGIIISLLESILIGVFYYLAFYFTNILHFSVQQSSLVISCYGLGAVLGGILGGKLSDRYSPTSISAYSLAIQGLSYLALIKLHSQLYLMGDLFIIGISTYSFITANYLSVLDTCRNDEAQRLKAINFLSITANLGLGLSALIIGFALSLGFNTLFIISGMITLIVAAYLILEPKQIHPAKEEIISQNTVTTTVNKNTVTTALICVFLVGMIVAQMCSIYPIYITKNFFTPGMPSISLLFALNSFMVVFFEAPIGNFLKDSNKLHMVGIGSLLIGGGMLLLIVSHQFLFAIISCMVYTLGEIIFFCMAQLVCYQKAKIGKKGLSLGLFRMVYASSRVLGPLAGAFLYSHYNSDLIWILCGVIGIFCFSLCYMKQIQRVDVTQTI